MYPKMLLNRNYFIYKIGSFNVGLSLYNIILINRVFTAEHFAPYFGKTDTQLDLIHAKIFPELKKVKLHRVEKRRTLKVP